eukprot:8978676-Alexandrium_andersonii.AAC.1
MLRAPSPSPPLPSCRHGLQKADTRRGLPLPRRKTTRETAAAAKDCRCTELPQESCHRPARARR